MRVWVGGVVQFHFSFIILGETQGSYHFSFFLLYQALLGCGGVTQMTVLSLLQKSVCFIVAFRDPTLPSLVRRASPSLNV